MKTNVLRHVSEIKDQAVFKRAPNRPWTRILFKPSLLLKKIQQYFSIVLYCDIKLNVSKCARVLSYSSRRGERKTDDVYSFYSKMKTVPACVCVGGDGTGRDDSKEQAVTKSRAR